MNSPLKNVQTAFGSVYLRYWVAATVAGVFLSQFIAATSFNLLALLPNSETTTLFYEHGFGPLLYLLLGLGMGACQWLFIRRHFRKAYGWIVATALGYLFGVILHQVLSVPMLSTFADPSVWGIAPLFASDLADRLSATLFIGFAIGVAQWLFLKRHNISGATVWIWLAIAARILVLALPEVDFYQASPLLFGLDEPQLVPYIVFSLARTCLEGVILGVLTGLPLVGFIAQIQERARLRSPS